MNKSSIWPKFRALLQSSLQAFSRAIRSPSLFFTLAVFLAVGFAVGLFASLYQIGGRSWVPAAIDKTKQVLKISTLKAPSPLSFSSARYEWNVLKSVERKGVYQLGSIDQKTVLAVDRNNGTLLSFELDGKDYKQSTISENIFPDGINTSGQGQTNAPVIMDLHYAFGRLFYSIVLLNDSSSCLSMAMYEVPISQSKELKITGKVIKRFETPCVKDLYNSVMFAGRITHNETKLFLSVGEERYDRSGYPKSDIFSKSDLELGKTVFGKVLEFDVPTFNYQTFSSGHRNAQGLYWDSESAELLASEHGPNGGDEVNVLVKGLDYGWPRVSFGKPYAIKFPSNLPEFHDSKNPAKWVDTLPSRAGLSSGKHNGFQFPLFSWIPGVGVGNLVKVSSASPLVDWRGNIIVALMGEGTLHRLILHNGGVVLDETMNSGRIRDFEILSNGDMALAFDSGRLVFFRTDGI